MKTRLIAAMALLLSFSSSAVAGDLNRLLSVKGMSCEACSAKVEHALTGVSGVKTAAVDLKSGQAKVIADRRGKAAGLGSAGQKGGVHAWGGAPAPRVWSSRPWGGQVCARLRGRENEAATRY